MLSIDDVLFPHITYRREAAGIPTPVIRGTGVRVQAVAIAHQQWQMDAAALAVEYGLPVKQIEEVLAFWSAHRTWIEAHIAYEQKLACEQYG